jgi:hypothetical protein
MVQKRHAAQPRSQTESLRQRRRWIVLMNAFAGMVICNGTWLLITEWTSVAVVGRLLISASIGAFGGFVLGESVRLSDPTFSWVRVAGLTAVWAVAFGLLMGGALVTLTGVMFVPLATVGMFFLMRTRVQVAAVITAGVLSCMVNLALLLCGGTMLALFIGGYTISRVSIATLIFSFVSSLIYGEILAASLSAMQRSVAVPVVTASPPTTGAIPRGRLSLGADGEIIVVDDSARDGDGGG